MRHSISMVVEVVIDIRELGALSITKQANKVPPWSLLLFMPEWLVSIKLL